MPSVRPKKRLGQHFLHDHNIARKITESIPRTEGLSLLEVGPGTGALTGMLLEEFGENFFAVEIDKEAADYLRETYPALAPRLLEEDFLSFRWEDYFEGQVGIVGNFPYNISSQIFFHVLEHFAQIPFVVGMVQKEVAERIAAGPGSREYGILSVLLQACYKVEYLFTVGEKVFIPPPRVKSAVVRLTRLTAPEAAVLGPLKSIVRQAFNQRRKMLRNSLSSYASLLKKFPQYASMRPEQLSVTDFIALARAL